MDKTDNEPVSQMTYNGGLVPVNSRGLRQVIDDAGKLREEIATLREQMDAKDRRIEAARAVPDGGKHVHRGIGDPGDCYPCAVRAALSPTGEPKEEP